MSIYGSQDFPGRPAWPAHTESAAGAPHAAPTVGSRRPAALTAAPTLFTLLGALRRRWRMAVLLAALTVPLAAGLVWKAIPPSRHVARAMLHVASSRPNVIFPTQETQTNFEIYKQTQLRLLKGRIVLAAVMRDPNVKALDLIERLSRQGD